MPFFKKLTLYEKAQIAKRNNAKQAELDAIKKEKETIDQITSSLIEKGKCTKSGFYLKPDKIIDYFEELGFNVSYGNGYLTVDVKDE